MKNFCPVGDVSCPYYCANGECGLPNPARDCDDYLAYYTDEDDWDYEEDD